ncbi:MAG: 50S ribosomal protein L6 [Deltaproteobacteria bacterium]|nr:50S ribosomal protein L6 [Deltaproteobacteria bacterium]
MSRIGKRPITVPAGVKVAVAGNNVKVTGKIGTLEINMRPEVGVEIQDSNIQVIRKDEGRMGGSFHGLTRTLIANMVKGVSEGFEKKLDIIGVGYKADLQGSLVNLVLGYSHPIKYQLPQGISASIEKQTAITIKGADKQLVGQVAAEIRAMRPPEPYKGKGIKYSAEVVRRKAGKAGKGAGSK